MYYYNPENCSIIPRINVDKLGYSHTVALFTNLESVDADIILDVSS